MNDTYSFGGSSGRAVAYSLATRYALYTYPAKKRRAQRCHQVNRTGLFRSVPWCSRVPALWIPNECTTFIYYCIIKTGNDAVNGFFLEIALNNF